MKHTISYLSVAFMLFIAVAANAQVVVETNAQTIDPTVRTLAGITLGSEYGYGVALRYGSDKLAVEFGGGFSPLYTFWIKDFNDPTKDDEWHFKVLNNLIAAAKLDFMIKNTPDQRMGIKIGVEYSTIRTYGAGVALSLQVHKAPYVFVTAGYSYYPEGAAKVRAELERNNDYDIEQNDFDEIVDNSSIVIGVNFFLWP